MLLAAGMQTAGAGRTLAEAQVPASVHLPPGSGTSGGGRLLVWALGHASSGLPAGWAAGDDRPGILTTDLLPAGVHRLAELVRQHKRPGDLALVSVHWGANWGYQVPEEQRRFAHSLIDEGERCVRWLSSHVCLCKLLRLPVQLQLQHQTAPAASAAREPQQGVEAAAGPR
jgi:poly-gamma-glutamate synthesis protein (capsule biosynthesis protein)